MLPVLSVRSIVIISKVVIGIVVVSNLQCMTCMTMYKGKLVYKWSNTRKYVKNDILSWMSSSFLRVKKHG